MNDNYSRVGHILFAVSVTVVIVAAIIGIGLYSTEDGGPAPYMVAAAFLLFVGSYYFLRKAKKNNPAVPGSWLRWVVLVLISVPIIWLILFIIGLAACAQDQSCQLFTF